MKDQRTLCLELRPGRHIKIGDDVTLELGPDVAHNVRVVFKAPPHVDIQRSDRRRKSYEETFNDEPPTNDPA